MPHIRDAYEPFDIAIEYVPDKYPTAEEACKVFYKCLVACTPALAQYESEVYLLTPDDCRDNGLPPRWGVGWEAGPADWAVAASIEFMRSQKHGWYTETYYGFDLYFVESKT